jgi:hypothetical protein
MLGSEPGQISVLWCSVILSFVVAMAFMIKLGMIRAFTNIV